MTERWRPVVGYEGAYEVSSEGRVRSLTRPVYYSPGGGRSGYWRDCRGQMLRPGISGHGYPTVCLGRGNTKTVHQLVAAAFIGPVPEGMEVLHKDGTRTNARADNLRYGTRTENILDAVAAGTWMSEKRARHMQTTFRGARWK